MKRSKPPVGRPPSFAVLAAALLFTINCGGDGLPTPQAPAEVPSGTDSPTEVPLGNFNMSCGQQQQQIQTKFQQQQSPGCAPQFVFSESKLSDWEVQLNCDARRVEIQSTGLDRRNASIPIASDGTVQGKMSFQQQVKSDRKGHAVCWVEYQVVFDGKASCGGGGIKKGLNLSTQVAFEKSNPDQLPTAAGIAANLDSAAVATMHTVRILPNAMDRGSQAFGENPLRVDAGSTVSWTNDDTVTHTITSDSGDFDSGTVPPGGTFSHTFSVAGTFPYHCEIHPGMRGQVAVAETANPEPTLTLSPIPTAAPTFSGTPSPSSSPSVSPSASPSVSPSPSPSPSPSSSPSPSRSPSPRPVPTQTATITPVQICVVEKPCPVQGYIDYSCPDGSQSNNLNSP